MVIGEFLWIDNPLYGDISVFVKLICLYNNTHSLTHLTLQTRNVILNTFIRLIFIVVLILIPHLLFAQSSQPEPSFSKISYQDEVLANKIIISLHHAVLEVNREEKYLIAKLTSDENYC